MAAINILQERTLKIDQRLAVLGIFLNQLDENIKAKKYSELLNLAKTFSTRRKIYETVQEIWRTAKFQPKDFVQKMFAGILEILYGRNRANSKFESQTWAELKKTFKLNSIYDAIKIFVSLNERRENFIQSFETIFENYLVNEFFMNCYPYHIEKSIQHNFSVFVVAYKIIELFIFMLAMTSQANEIDILNAIGCLSGSIDHYTEYLNNLSAELDDMNDITRVISTFLNTGNF